MMSANYNMRNAGSGVDLPKQIACARGLSRGLVRKISDTLHQPALAAAPPIARYTYGEANGSSRENRTRDKVANSRVNHHQLLFGS